MRVLGANEERDLMTAGALSSGSLVSKPTLGALSAHNLRSLKPSRFSKPPESPAT